MRRIQVVVKVSVICGVRMELRTELFNGGKVLVFRHTILDFGMKQGYSDAPAL
jgi:hypothetical protein